jgi:hypothetical protein
VGTPQVAYVCNGTRAFTIGGILVGLPAGESVVLRVNGGFDFSITNSGLPNPIPFSFPTPIETGATYSVSVAKQPNVGTCSVANGAATVGTSNVTSVVVDCTQVLATGDRPSGGIAVDARNVYWTETDSTAVGGNGTIIRSVPLSGGIAWTMMSTYGPPFDLAGNATRVYWGGTDPGNPDGTLWAMAIPPPPYPDPPTAWGVAVPSLPRAIAATDASVYWLGSNGLAGTGVYRTDAGGVTVGPIANTVSPDGDIALDATHLYWTDRDASGLGSIMMVTFLGGTGGGIPGTPTTLYSDSTKGQHLAADGTNLYWASPNSGTVMKVPGGGGTATVLANVTSCPSSIGAIDVAADGTDVYWVNGCDGTVMKVSRWGGAVTMIAFGQYLWTPTDIAGASITLDATYVYWTDPTHGTVMKAPK